MIRHAATLALLSFSLATLVAADEKKPTELEGTYKIVAAERDGTLAQKTITDSATVTIKDDELTMSRGTSETHIARIKLTPDAKPARIDLSPQDGAERGKTFPGIYRIEKGEITLAFSEKGNRPKTFKSEAGVVVLRLKKAGK